MEKVLTKAEAWSNKNRIEYDVEEQQLRLQKAKEDYSAALVEEVSQEMLSVLREEGTLTERDFKIFIGSLARDIKHLYTN